LSAYLDASVLVSVFTTDDHTPRVLAWLAVEPQQVVLIQAESADRCL